MLIAILWSASICAVAISFGLVTALVLIGLSAAIVALAINDGIPFVDFGDRE